MSETPRKTWHLKSIAGAVVIVRRADLQTGERVTRWSEQHVEQTVYEVRTDPWIWQTLLDLYETVQWTAPGAGHAEGDALRRQVSRIVGSRFRARRVRSPPARACIRRAVGRFGDDNVAVMGGNPYATPIPLGVGSVHCDDSAAFHNRHFGLEYDGIVEGEPMPTELPLGLAEQCRQHDMRDAVWANFPETHGMAEFPFHSKARAYLRALAGEAKLRRTDLSRPLPNSINFEVAPVITAWVLSRLRSHAGFAAGWRPRIVGRKGVYLGRQDWGHLWREDLGPSSRREGLEFLDFMRIMRNKDPRWLFVVMEDRPFTG